MKVQEVIRRLREGTASQLYVVHGEEKHLHDQVYGALEAYASKEGFGAWNLSVLYGHKDLTAQTVAAELRTAAWGSGERVVVVKGAHLVPAEELTQLADTLEEEPDLRVLALFFDALDKRLKSSKRLRSLGEEVDCSAVTHGGLVRWVMDAAASEGLSMDRETAEFFCHRVGLSLLLAHQEWAKLSVYLGGEKAVRRADVEAVVCLGPDRQADGAVFDLVEAMSAKDGRRAQEILHSLFRAGEAPLRILPLIERQLRLLTAAKSSGRPSETAKAMGEKSDYALKRAMRNAQNFSLAELLEGFHRVVAADAAIKTGVDGEQVLEELVYRLAHTEKLI